MWDEKKRIRMWKKGKIWIFGAVTSLLFMGGGLTAQAESDFSEDEPTSELTSLAENKTDVDTQNFEASEAPVTYTVEKQNEVVSTEETQDSLTESPNSVVDDENENTGNIQEPVKANTINDLKAEEIQEQINTIKAFSLTENKFLSIDEIKKFEPDVSSSVLTNAYIISNEAAKNFVIPEALGWTDIQVSRVLLKIKEDGYYVMGYNGVTGKAVVIEYDSNGQLVSFKEINENELWAVTDITNLSDVTVHKDNMTDEAWETRFSLTKDPITDMLIFTVQNLALSESNPNSSSYGMGPSINLIVREPLGEGTVRVTVTVYDKSGNAVDVIDLGNVTKTNYSELTNAVNEIRASYLSSHPDYFLLTDYITTNDGVIILTPQGYYTPGTYFQGNDTQYTILSLKGTHNSINIYSGIKKLLLGNNLSLTQEIVLRDGSIVTYADLLEAIKNCSSYDGSADSYQVHDTNGDGIIDLDDYGRLGWTLQNSAYVDAEGNKVFGINYWYLCPPNGHIEGNFLNEHETTDLALSADFTYYGNMSLYTFKASETYWTIQGRLQGLPKGYAAGNHVHFEVAPINKTDDKKNNKDEIIKTSEKISEKTPLIKEQSLLPKTNESKQFSYTIIGSLLVLVFSGILVCEKFKEN